MADGSGPVRIAPHNAHDAIMHHLVSALELMGYEVRTAAPSQVDIIPGAEKMIRRCQQAVCDATNLKLPDLLSARRQASLTRPRHLAMWLAIECTRASYPRIGRAFCRDHSTIIHAIRSFERHRAADPVYAELAERLRSQLMEEFSR